MRYRDAGVDVARADALKDALGRAVRSTWTPAVRSLAGGFAGVMEFPGSGLCLAATMDGVGTKLHLAQQAGRLAVAAADLVYHGANDLLVHGAKPLAFLDYIAQSRLDPDTVLAIVDGLARACRELGCALLGGETAEMPDTYLPGVVDVAGCMIGTVAAGAVFDGSRVRAGDVVLGLGSGGLHTNGFSLARRVLSASGLPLEAPLPGGDGESLGAALLAPHRAYGHALLPLLEDESLHAMAHVTGGGIAGNLVRVLPTGCAAVIDPDTWRRPAVFRWLIEAGGVPEPDAREALNLGLGMLVVVAPSSAVRLADALRRAGESVTPMGTINTGERAVRWRDT